MVVGLIPSTTDSQRIDRTVSRCIRIALRDGHNELLMLNMFSACTGAANHREAALQGTLVCAVEECNDQHLSSKARDVRAAGGKVVVAWGRDGWSRHSAVLEALGAPVYCFVPKGVKDTAGFPRHPLMRGAALREVTIVEYG